MKVQLKLIETTSAKGTGLRTESVIGESLGLPSIGEGFYMVSGDVLTPGASIREIMTSPVTNIARAADGKSLSFRTKNSSYELTLLPRGENDNS